MRLVLAAAIAMVLAAPALAKPPAGPDKIFTARDLFSLEIASDPRIKPDGSAIAYVRSTYDIMGDKAVNTIWLADANGGGQAPIAAGAGSYGSPRWSPDGKRLAYVASTDGGSPQLYVRWMATGVAARLATLAESPGDISWSPDGRSIAFTMFIPDEGETLGSPLAKPEGAKWAAPLTIIGKVNYRADGAGYLRPGYNKVFVIDADGGAPRQLTFGAYDDTGPLAWTPDGKAVLFASSRGADWERDPVESEIYRVTVADGTVAALTDRNGPDFNPVVSPDGRTLAWLGFDDKGRAYEDNLLYVMPLSGGTPRAVTTGLDRAVDGAQWSADNKSLVIQYTDHGITKLARVTLDGTLTPIAQGLTPRALDRPYAGGEFSLANNGMVAFTAGDPNHPSDLAVATKSGTKRLTRLNDELFQGKALGQVTPLLVNSSFDGKKIDAWIVTPPNFDPSRKYPLLLEIHGGPFAAYGPVWSSEDQLYAAAGYIVVYANPRGSTSQGAAFANLIDKDYPSHDYDDLMSVVDAAIGQGSVDPNNLFVTGGSGGGVLTAWIVGKTHRFKAAVSQKPVINWSSFVLTSDGYPLYGPYWLGKQPWEDPTGYWAHSPLSLVGNVTTPTMVLVGEEDRRTPPSESEQLYQALQLRKIPTMLVRVPGASHGGLAERPSQLAAENAAIVAWFERYRTK
ncbi:dipeptidyl aminopeptidase/acylaminoacyl peptidase [Caulobacter ginsengisoli]|uniref:Dipeptidyl aminopeptidase/acylaminoacyl peptidase n=1 Tax=Caulobacter ginsengisoli TaxID=400775 RepID=A0ABU0IWV1_9CAUL|nr:S9 family peptidase [Caulobacter ginsengisoli]MDQ0465422.1 dipeptidyl aminopeptidase/acylaminoacyl peptidase [Caulobacter ginsengisoli]